MLSKAKLSNSARLVSLISVNSLKEKFLLPFNMTEFQVINYFN